MWGSTIIRRRKLFLQRVVLSLSLAFLPGAVCAQSHFEGNVFWGAKGGAGISRVFFNPSVKQKFPVGAVAGLMFRYIEENHFGLIAELNFEQRGWKENFETTRYSYRRTLNYIQIPVLAHIYFGSPRAHFFLNAGPEIGFMVGESTFSNFDTADIANLPDFPIKDRQVAQLTLPCDTKVDYGISAGLGAEVFLNGRNSLCFEARFYYGLGNIMKTGRTEPFSSANSMGLMATFGYWFRAK